MFAERLKQLRNDAHITQTALAKVLYVSQQNVAKWEVGTSTPDPNMLTKIADYFNVTTDYLLGRTDDAGLGSNIQITDENNRPIVLDDDALELIDSLRSRPEMKMLFSVSKKATAEDIIKAVKIIEALKDESEN